MGDFGTLSEISRAMSTMMPGRSTMVPGRSTIRAAATLCFIESWHFLSETRYVPASWYARNIGFIIIIIIPEVFLWPRIFLLSNRYFFVLFFFSSLGCSLGGWRSDLRQPSGYPCAIKIRTFLVVCRSVGHVCEKVTFRVSSEWVREWLKKIVTKKICD